MIVDCDRLEAAEEYSISKPSPASSEFIELVNLIMTEDEIQVSSNADEGLVLYRHLLHTIVHNRQCS